jgi:hypothetical protein
MHERRRTITVSVQAGHNDVISTPDGGSIPRFRVRGLRYAGSDMSADGVSTDDTDTKAGVVR